MIWLIRKCGCACVHLCVRLCVRLCVCVCVWVGGWVDVRVCGCGSVWWVWVWESICVIVYMCVCVSRCVSVGGCIYGCVIIIIFLFICKRQRLSALAQLLEAGNTKGSSITVPLTSCLTGLQPSVWQLTIFVFIWKTD